MHKNQNYIIHLDGDRKVGKSSLLFRFVEGKFISSRIHNMEGEGYKSRMIDYHNWIIAQVWDKDVWTRLNNRANKVGRAAHSWAHAIVVVFDITNLDSLDYAKKLCLQHRSNFPNKPIMLVGNKTDLDEKICNITDDDFFEFGKKNNIIIRLVSAKTGIGVNEVFEDLVKKVIERELKKVALKKLEKEKRIMLGVIAIATKKKQEVLNRYGIIQKILSSRKNSRIAKRLH